MEFVKSSLLNQIKDKKLLFKNKQPIFLKIRRAANCYVNSSYIL